MLKGFSTKQLIFIALMGALVFVLAFSISVGINTITGTPMLGGIFANLLLVFLWVIVLLTIPKFGTGMLLGLIHTVLSSPTTNFGPPGFYKIILGLFIGLLIDIILYVGRYKRLSYYIGTGLGMASAIPLMFFALTLLGMPEAGKVQALLITGTAIYLVEALIATYLARLFYNKKLKNLRLIKQISS